MCGIVGYIGEKNATSVLLSGLKKLEYRGYDSCGIATIYNNEFHINKTTNRIDSLCSCIQNEEISNIGLGHTRWATHGGVCERNAHPHLDSKKRFAVVHNGIIENYVKLKELLESKGYVFVSDTDTEVIPNLIDYNFNGNLLEATKKTTEMLEGSYALGIIQVDNPDLIVATKKNSPLIVGIGENENFMASDFSAILKYTDKICILENNEFAVLEKNKISFYDSNLNKKEKEIKKIETKDIDSEKNGYEHFMLKEINEDTIAVKNTLNEYIDNGKIKFELGLSDEELNNIKHIHIVACGTAMHAGLNGKYLIEKLTRIPVNVDVASEFRYRNPILEKDDLVIFISQSGETADTIACLELVKERKIKHISIVNVKESTIDRISDNVLYTKAGIEIAVASTKAYIAQVVLLDLFSIYLAQKRNSFLKDDLEKILNCINELPNKMQEVLENDGLYIEYAKKIYQKRDVFYLGRGLDYYAALEGSLKLKEISYIHSEATQFGELKHGPIALIEKNTPAIVMSTSSGLMDKTISNIKEIVARGADVLVITTIKDFPDELANQVIHLPEINEDLSPLLTMIPLQLIAYHITVLKGLDVDKPRNLAKSVTVE